MRRIFENKFKRSLRYTLTFGSWYILSTRRCVRLLKREVEQNGSNCNFFTNENCDAVVIGMLGRRGDVEGIKFCVNIVAWS